MDKSFYTNSNFETGNDDSGYSPVQSSVSSPTLAFYSDFSRQSPSPQVDVDLSFSLSSLSVSNDSYNEDIVQNQLLSEYLLYCPTYDPTIIPAMVSLWQKGPVECYHPSGAAGAGYMPSSSGGAQPSAQASLRVQPTPQPSAPPAPQQDMSKTTMAGHSYVSQNQTTPTRPSFANYPYRTAQHGTRPNTHPRQQQPYIPNAAATASPPVMYPTLLFQPSPMGMQTFQQPRSSTPGYYPYMGYINYNTPPSHTPPYFYTSNNPQLPTPNLQASAPGGRSNPTTLVGPQGTPATPTAPTATLPHPQASTLMHQTMPGIRSSAPKRSHRVPIIDPKTKQDIFSDLYTNDSNYISNEANDRHTPQPEPTHSIPEEFNRMVKEVANQPSCDNSIKSTYVTNNVDVPAASTPSSVQSQPIAVNSLNNNIVKSETLTVNENKHLGPDVAGESNDTPIVSAISDSPVIVPKMPMNIKQLQKNSEPLVQPVVLDTNKNLPPSKPFKPSKNVPQHEDHEKPQENIIQVPIATVAPISSSTVITSTVTPVPASTQTATASEPPTPVPISTPAPQPQRIREPRERVKSEDKEKVKERESQEKEAASASNKLNGPTPPLVISSVDSLAEAIILPTSQSNQGLGVEAAKKLAIKQISPALEAETTAAIASNVELVKSEPIVESPPTATQLLSASIEKVAKEQFSKAPELKEGSSAIEAQAKLTQSISSVLRTNQSDFKMKDINLNNKTTDPDTANGNTTETTKAETVREDINKNEKGLKNTKNNNKKSNNKMANNESNVKEVESYENGKNETDKVVNVEKDNIQPDEEVAEPTPVPEEPTKDEPPAPQIFVPKYKYNEDQWSPLNTAGKKCYDIDLLKQIKDDPLSKNKPNVPLLEHCNVIRTTPMQEPQPFTPMSRPMNDSLFPPFAKNSGMGSRSNAPRETKKDSRNATPSGKGSVKLPPNPNSNSSHKPVIHVSLSLREEVKLNEVDSAWKPTRFRKDQINEEEYRTQELYKKFRGILNKLTPQKFDTLLERVKTLEINNQKRLEGVIDLVFEKAIDEPNFSEAYAAMCHKLSVLKVPADNPTMPDNKCVNFRALIINKCQNQFETHKVDEQILKLESELAACSDPLKKKELQLMIDEENRRVRMRSVGNVRFIGELYKLKMLTSKIMDYCMKYLIDKVEEEKLECLCKLLTTIGEQVESEPNTQLDNIFKKMKEIVDRKSNKISSRVRFMLQDVIELRDRKWVAKTVIDSQPKMMDQIQKEAEQQQRHIELMNASPIGGFRRDEGGRGKRGDSRRQNSNNSFIDNNWKTRNTYTVDTSKLKAVTQKNLHNIKLAPQNSAWHHGSGTKNTAQASSTPMISISKNMYSVLENVQTDPTSLRGNRDMTPNFSKGASIERSTFNSRGDFTASGSSSRSGSVGVARSNSGTRSTSAAPTTPPVVNDTPAPAPAPAPIPQEPLPEAKKKSIKSMIDLCIINSDEVEMVADVKQLYEPKYHAAVVNEILQIAVEKPAKEIALISKALLNLVTSNTITADNFVAGLKEILEFAPDLFIDIPMLYENLGRIIAPQIEKKHITFVQIFRFCEVIISANHGPLFLKAVLRELIESMGPSFVKSKWHESGLQVKQWMDEKQVTKWLEDNKFEFLEGDTKVSEEAKNIMTPAQTQAKLIQLMNADESCECIKGWIQDKLSSNTNEDWFMRALIQAICEHALFGAEGRDVPHFNQDRMNKYASLIHDFGETKQSREASCLFGIQQLIRRLEHPQGLTLEIFQYLHEQYIISLDGFIAWEESEKEPEGKGVMMKALTSFFTNIKEADNEDSCSED
ncbi:eukaryotic translation initiation factor 4 gamma 3 isoform X3 [Spodoptera frugiperda]|uniref:Eukaryotic translation initiation factor 4 gamma 3 isoform X3 n=1 Tax=Spodoptera frugiperda TaxID=7108 RepID=A0A9R0DK17_SPOFR|nr:eukaryotic translation initiation factor 4 gamma 3 isoform X3 [Spodoptera frugiperda]